MFKRTEAEQREWNVFQYMPKHKSNRGTTPNMQGPSIMGANTKPTDQWFFPSLEPGGLEIRRHLGCCINIAFKIIYETHTYTFGGEIYLQQEGGPTGLRFTGAAARIRMVHWHRKLMGVLLNIGESPWLSKGYVDDIKLGVKLLRLGTRWDPDTQQLVHDPNLEAHENKYNLPRDRKTAEIYADIMSGIDEDLTFTTEAESDYENSRIPTLDFTMKLVKKFEIRDQVEMLTEIKIEYGFF